MAAAANIIAGMGRMIFDRSSITREGLLGIVQTGMRVHHHILCCRCLLGGGCGNTGRVGPMVRFGGFADFAAQFLDFVALVGAHLGAEPPFGGVLGH